MLSLVGALLLISCLSDRGVAASSSAGSGYPNPKGGSYQKHQQPYPSPAKIQYGTLKQVHIIFRHGDRAPIGTYPNDPNKNYDWPFGRAQLTDVGKLQHYELGNYLRNRYTRFFTSDPREIVVRSSDKDRCLSSAAVNLAALFRPTGKWVWNNDLDWQPVPIQTAPSQDDWLLNEDSECPAAEAIKRNVMQTPEGIAYAKKYKTLFEFVTEKSGKTVNDPNSVLSVYGITYINKLKNLQVQEWVGPIWEEFTRAANEAFVVGFVSKPYLRMRGGPLLGHITNLMLKRSRDEVTGQPKGYMFSTHDAIVCAFMTAVGVFNGLQVPYAAAVLLELHQHPRKVNEYTVRMFYRNTTQHEPFQLIVPGCELDCPLEDFRSLLRDTVPTDVRRECYGTDKPSPAKDSQSSCCCCSSQCPSVPQPFLNQHGPQPGQQRPFAEKLSRETTAQGRIQELLFQMNQVFEQHLQSVEQSLRELTREMSEVDADLARMKIEQREIADHVSQQKETSRKYPSSSGHGK